MRKFFVIVNREGRFGLDLVVESRVTGEVFLLLFESRDPEFPILSEFFRMLDHAAQVRHWLKTGVIKFAGKQVVYCKVYV